MEKLFLPVEVFVLLASLFFKVCMRIFLFIFSFNDVYTKQFQRLYRFKCEGKFNMYVVL